MNSLKYVEGVPKVLGAIKRKGLITAIISASAIDAARRVQRDYGIDHIFANELVIRNGRVSGEFVWPIGAGKERLRLFVICAKILIFQQVK